MQVIAGGDKFYNVADSFLLSVTREDFQVGMKKSRMFRIVKIN